MIKETAQILTEDFPILVGVFVFLFGICVGSFLNVCIYRIPKHESIVVVPSHCMTCNKKLKWYELVPLFSFLFLRGKCSGCKSKISPQYPIVEGTHGLLWVLVFALKGLTPDMLLIQLFFSALFVIAVIDARTKEIPLGVNLFIAVLGVPRAIFCHSSVSDAVLGLLVPGTVFLLILFISNGKAMGGGDVKLLYAAGLFLGLKNTLFALAVACVLGAIIHPILMKVKHLGRELAFGPYLAAGFASAALVGTQAVSWYLSLFNIN